MQRTLACKTFFFRKFCSVKTDFQGEISKKQPCNRNRNFFAKLPENKGLMSNALIVLMHPLHWRCRFIINCNTRITTWII